MTVLIITITVHVTPAMTMLLVAPIELIVMRVVVKLMPGRSQLMMPFPSPTLITVGRKFINDNSH
jgi:hypothetical protein